MEVKAKDKIEKSNELKVDADGKSTDRKEHTEHLQQVRERKLQQLRYKSEYEIV